jgi:hypothetical protein
LALLVAVAASACDGSPTSPSLEGEWTGTWEFRTAGVLVTEDVTASFNQNGAAVTGTWTAASGPSGGLTFTASDSSSGTLTITQTMFTGQVCNGTSTVSGSASRSSIELAAAPIPVSGLCQWATEIRFSLHK